MFSTVSVSLSECIPKQGVAITYSCGDVKLFVGSTSIVKGLKKLGGRSLLF
jgi:hypothetical protein